MVLQRSLPQQGRGAVLLGLFLVLAPRVEDWVGKRPLNQQLLVTIGAPVVLAIVYPHSETVASAAVMAGFGSGLVAIPLLALMFPLSIVVPVVGLLEKYGLQRMISQHQKLYSSLGAQH